MNHQDRCSMDLHQWGDMANRPVRCSCRDAARACSPCLPTRRPPDHGTEPSHPTRPHVAPTGLAAGSCKSIPDCAQVYSRPKAASRPGVCHAIWPPLRQENTAGKRHKARIRTKGSSLDRNAENAERAIQPPPPVCWAKLCFCLPGIGPITPVFQVPPIGRHLGCLLFEPVASVPDDLLFGVELQLPEQNPGTQENEIRI